MRQRAWQVCPAARERARVERPQPPVAPRKAIVWGIVGVGVLGVFLLLGEMDGCCYLLLTHCFGEFVMQCVAREGCVVVEERGIEYVLCVNDVMCVCGVIEALQILSLESMCRKKTGR